jgi:copper chaperone
MTELKIDGMTCGHCTAAVKKALERVPGVAGAEVDLATGRARVAGTADATMLVAAVQDEGYQAAPLAS